MVCTYSSYSSFEISLVDDEVAVAANHFMIREVDLDDPDFFLGSRNMSTIALAHGLWDGQGKLDFTAAFSLGAIISSIASRNLRSSCAFTASSRRCLARASASILASDRLTDR